MCNQLLRFLLHAVLGDLSADLPHGPSCGVRIGGNRHSRACAVDTVSVQLRKRAPQQDHVQRPPLQHLGAESRLLPQLGVARTCGKDQLSGPQLEYASRLGIHQPNATNMPCRGNVERQTVL